jgi:hypothetical protein
VPCLALSLPSCRGEGRLILVAFKRQKPPKEGEGARAYREIPKNTIFQSPIQNNSFSENFTWVEAVRKSPPVAFLIFGPHFSPMVLYARAQLKDYPAPALSNVIPKVYI